MRGNPNHPVVREAKDQWHKLCAIALHKLGVIELEITAHDIEELTTADLANIVLDTRPGDVLLLRLVSNAEAETLAREHGGLEV